MSCRIWKNLNEIKEKEGDMNKLSEIQPGQKICLTKNKINIYNCGQYSYTIHHNNSAFRKCKFGVHDKSIIIAMKSYCGIS